MNPRRSLAAAFALAGCAAAPPPAPVAAPTPRALPPLERICGEALPLRERTVGELARTLSAIDPAVRFETRPCDATTAWPISFAQGEADRPPVGIAVLRMEGDALLTLDARDRDAPTVKLCAEVEARLGEGHRFFAVALWDSGDDAAFDPAHLAQARAELAWLEVRSRRPTACALGEREADDRAGDDELRERLRCALPNFVTPLRDGCPPAPAAAAADAPDGVAMDRAVVARHRFSFTGRSSVRDADLVLARPERCVHEPAPATRDVCLAEYTRAGHTDERWFGRGDVTRTGTGGAKNYVDSYLTFQLLKRLEAERRQGRLGPAAPSEK